MKKLTAVKIKKEKKIKLTKRQKFLVEEFEKGNVIKVFDKNGEIKNGE